MLAGEEIIAALRDMAGNWRQTWRVASWLGLAATCVQAALPLVVALLIPLVTPAERGWSIHHHVASHESGPTDATRHTIAAHGGVPHSPGQPVPHGGHARCPLCLALQAGGPALPTEFITLSLPAISRPSLASGSERHQHEPAAPVHYASRAPPSDI